MNGVAMQGAVSGWRRRTWSRAVVCGLVLVSVSVVGVAGVASAAATGVGVTVAGGNGRGAANNQLVNPDGVAVDASGNV